MASVNQNKHTTHTLLTATPRILIIKSHLHLCPHSAQPDSKCLSMSKSDNDFPPRMCSFNPTGKPFLPIYASLNAWWLEWGDATPMILIIKSLLHLCPHSAQPDSKCLSTSKSDNDFPPQMQALTRFSISRKSREEMVHFFLSRSGELNFLFSRCSRLSRFWRKLLFLFLIEWDFANRFSSQGSKFSSLWRIIFRF